MSTPARTDLVFWTAQVRRAQFNVHYVFAGPGIESRFANGVKIDPGFPGLFFGVAEVVAMRPRPYLYQILATDTERCRGVGLALLNEVRRRFGEVDALWCSREGAALASAFERQHGPQPWSYDPALAGAQEVRP